MSAWWLVVAFLVGWFACWKLSSFFVKHILRRGNVIMEEALSGLTQDALLKVAGTVETELAKRRAVPNQESRPS